MIVPMKKLTVITQAKDAEAAIRSLRSLGVVHVEHQQPPHGKEINAVQDDIALASAAVAVLSAIPAAKRASKKSARPADDWRTAARHIIDIRKRLDQLEEYSQGLSQRVNEWKGWGDFDPRAIQALEARNIYVRLYQIPLGAMNELPAGAVVKTLFTAGGVASCAVISREKIDMPFKEITPPKAGLTEMEERLAEDLRVTESLKTELRDSVPYRGVLSDVKARLDGDLEFRKALAGMGAEGEFSYVTGYIPHDMVTPVAGLAKKERWAIAINDPTGEDNVPTLIRNPRWVSIIEPVFRLMAIVPGYQELDISPLFLLFLSLFFGMIIGDAGYGALYIALTAFAHRKLGTRLTDTKIFFLLYLFSASAVMWGMLTGTVFGQEWYLRAGLRPLLPVLNDTKFLQAFCFFLGAFHLTLGQCWQAARKLPSLTALADIGWVAVLWAAFFVARMLILDYPLPAATTWLIWAGMALVLFFTNPQKNILKAAGAGLGALALNVMNNFTDVVSYVRLFAVGLAGVAISDTVNALAASFGGSSPAAQIGILFIGHTINIVLGPISVLVHGVRLNVLEFSSHAGLSWSGTAYKPLKP